MAEPARALPTFATNEAFLDWLERREDKFELEDGEPVPLFGGGPTGMAGAGPDHDAIVMNIAAVLLAALKGGGCRVHSSDRGVATRAPDPRGGTRDRHRFPDLSVSCTPERGRWLNEPVVIVEVLSPATADRDRGTKWEEYRALPSLRHYLLIEQDWPRATLYSRVTRDEWRMRDVEGEEAAVVLERIGVTLVLSDVYNEVKFDARSN